MSALYSAAMSGVAQIFSFFSGSGFLDLGFEDSGFDVAYVNEYHSEFLRAYKHSRRVLGHTEPRFGHHLGSIEDLSSLNRKETESHQHLCKYVEQARRLGPVGFIGGPPCPDFSVGGKNRGRIGDNGRLVSVYFDLIIEFKPDFFLFENVKGLWRTKIHREYYDEMKERLQAAGYSLTDRLLNSIEFGAPQDRDRIILIGFLTNKKPLNLEREFPWNRNIKYPARSAFAYGWPQVDDFAEDGIRQRPKDVPEELTVQHWFDKNAVSEHPNASHHFTPRAALPKFKVIKEGDDSKKSFKRLHRWRYSPTAAYGNNEVHLHPYLARRLSVAEALAVQSMPKEFQLPSDMTLSDMFKTVGNGVPYVMGVGLAQSLSHFISSQNDLDGIRPGKRNRKTAERG